MMKKELLRIPPYWAGMIGAVTGILIGLILMICGSGETDKDPLVLLIVCVLAFLYSCVHYDFGEDQLVVRFFGIPLRSVLYPDISSAVLIPRYNKYTGKPKGATVLLATVPYQLDDAKVWRLLRFGHRNPIKTIQMYILLGQEETCAAVLKRCLGDRFSYYAGRNG